MKKKPWRETVQKELDLLLRETSIEEIKEKIRETEQRLDEEEKGGKTLAKLFDAVVLVELKLALEARKNE